MCKESSEDMNTSRFDLYFENGKYGLIDIKTRKFILHSSYDVSDFDGEVFTLKNGDTLKIDDILSKVEWLTSNNRYMIVEDVVSRKVGIYDAKNDILKVKCVFDKIEYLNDKNGFRCYLDKQIKELDYKKLSSNKFSGKKSEIIIVNNLSLYYSEPFMIDMLNGKRTTLKR